MKDYLDQRRMINIDTREGCAMIIYFASNNEYKSKELLDIINPELPEAMEIRAIKIKIEEIQSADAEKIVREKVLRVFPKVRRPFFVAHTGLYTEYFGGLPGGLTKIHL